MKGRSWTENEDMELLRTHLRLLGVARHFAADAAVAWKLKRSRRTVTARRWRLAALLINPSPRPSWKPENDAELLRLRRNGCSFSETGRQLGVSKNAAVGRYHRLKRKENSNGTGAEHGTHSG